MGAPAGPVALTASLVGSVGLGASVRVQLGIPGVCWSTAGPSVPIAAGECSPTPGGALVSEGSGARGGVLSLPGFPLAVAIIRPGLLVIPAWAVSVWGDWSGWRLGSGTALGVGPRGRMSGRRRCGRSSAGGWVCNSGCWSMSMPWWSNEVREHARSEARSAWLLALVMASGGFLPCCTCRGEASAMIFWTLPKTASRNSFGDAWWRVAGQTWV